MTAVKFFDGTTWRTIPSTAGPQGLTGPQGATGAQGSQGVKGDPGAPLPPAGTTGQLLAKKTNANQDVEWINAPSTGAPPEVAIATGTPAGTEILWVDTDEPGVDLSDWVGLDSRVDALEAGDIALDARLDSLETARGVFYAYNSDANFTIVADGTFRKVKLSAEEFDSSNWFDSTTNWRYTPQRAGYYQINCLVNVVDNLNPGDPSMACVLKNGLEYRRFQRIQAATTYPAAGSGGGVVVLSNGTTDYFELGYYMSSSGSPARRIGSGSTITWMSGYYLGT